MIDPGPDRQDHLDAICDAAGGANAITHIFVTHAHHDHTSGVAALARRTGAPVLAFGPAHAGRSEAMTQLARTQGLAGGEGVDTGFVPDIDVAHGAVVETDTWSLTALHTPGHMSNHLCFADAERGILFSGDHVMGWSTTLISPPDGTVAAFLDSLDLLLDRDERLYMPGHGEVVGDGRARTAELKAHRQAREDQVIRQIEGGPRNLRSIALAIYTDLSPALLPAAERNVLAHLLGLWEMGRVSLPEDDMLGGDFLLG